MSTWGFKRCKVRGIVQFYGTDLSIENCPRALQSITPQRSYTRVRLDVQSAKQTQSGNRVAKNKKIRGLVSCQLFGYVFRELFLYRRCTSIPMNRRKTSVGPSLSKPREYKGINYSCYSNAAVSRVWLPAGRVVNKR